MVKSQVGQLFVANVRRIIQEQAITQGELARRLDTSAGNISRMLSEARAPDGETINKFAEILAVHPHEFLKPIASPPTEKPPPAPCKRGRK